MDEIVRGYTVTVTVSHGCKHPSNIIAIIAPLFLTKKLSLMVNIMFD